MRTWAHFATIKEMNLRYIFRKPAARRIVRQDIPYVSQWESTELIDDIWSKKMRTEDDPKWRNSGASSKSEYAEWSWAGCGLACTKMILAATGKENPPLVTLGKQALEFGAYQLPLATSPGLFYRPFVQFLASKYDLPARVTSRLSDAKIMRALARDGFVIASVSADIRYPCSTPAKKGGHLVLVVGYDRDREEFYIHNPSGTTAASQAFAAVSFADFAKFSARRGIIIG